VSGGITLPFVPGVLIVSRESRATPQDETGINDPLTLADIHAGDFPVSSQDLWFRVGVADTTEIEECVVV